MTRFHDVNRTRRRAGCGVRIGSLPAAAMLGLLLASMTPASASNIDDVRSMCAKSKICIATPSPPGDKGQDFCIDSKPGGSKCETLVACPGDRSDCFVLDIVAGQRRRLPGVDVGAVLLNSR
jgi:hypothetical protein